MKIAPIAMLLASACLIAAPSASLAKPQKAPADNLTKGIDFYNHGQMDKALAYLQDTVSKNPRKWQGHYYLGHTYLQLGQQAAAMEQYQLVQTCHPTPDVAAATQKMIYRLAATSIRHQSMPYRDTPGDARQLYVIQKKNQIYRQAGSESDQFRNATLQHIVKTDNTAGGNVTVDPAGLQIDRDRAKQLQLETEARDVNPKIEEARKKMRDMH